MDIFRLWKEQYKTLLLLLQLYACLPLSPSSLFLSLCCTFSSLVDQRQSPKRRDRVALFEGITQLVAGFSANIV